MQTRALTGHEARRWEPKRLRLRLLSHPGTARPHRPPPAAAPGRHRALHRPRPTGPRRARPAGRASRDSSAGLTPASSIPATAAMTGPWNRRPPERPRPNRHPHASLTPTRGPNPDDHRNDHDHERSGLTAPSRYWEWLVPRQVGGRDQARSKLGIAGSAAPVWTS
jgi:hypothetical protein